MRSRIREQWFGSRALLWMRSSHPPFSSSSKQLTTAPNQHPLLNEQSENHPAVNPAACLWLTSWGLPKVKAGGEMKRQG